MPSSLVDLPTELQLKIIGNLVRETFTEERNGNATKENWNTKHNSDLLNWSCTSSYFRDLLAPYVFETVKLQNNAKSGASVLELTRSRHHELVKELHFVGSAPGHAHAEDEAYRDTVAIFPKSVDTVLSDLRVLPNLETLSVKFDYRFDDYSEWEEGLRLGDKEESDEEVKEAEKEFAWRALMAKTYEALIRNETIELKTLEIKELLPRKVSTFTDPAFHAFLSRLERFSLSIYGKDNGAGWMFNKHHYYESMMEKLDEYFFNHLASATAFTLKAPEEGPLGLVGRIRIRLAFWDYQVPLLKTLHLEHIIICRQLIRFLLHHVQTLEYLSMNNCYSNINGVIGNEIYWEELFDALADASPERLSHVNINHKMNNSEDMIPLTYEEATGTEEDKARGSREVKEARGILQADHNRRLFAHIDTDHWVDTFHDFKENLASFQQGEDQASYDRLMRIVNANAAKIAGR